MLGNSGAVGRRGFLASAAIGIGSMFLSGASAAAAADDCVASPPAGALKGETISGVKRFLGVRYGESTGGENRFRPPVRARTWPDVQPATRYGSTASQAADLMPNPPEILRSYTMPDYIAQSEDCLFLNVWAPASGEGCPVMVWLHDGGFMIGGGSYLMEQGLHLARDNDVVVVSLNHRLGSLGYTDFSRVLGGDYAASDNLGMQDIVLALEWVRDNISAFGGDPNCVTVFGLSGGGMKISTLLGMPAAEGLFHRAIIQSGAFPLFLEPEDADSVALELLAALGIAARDVDALKTVPVENILAAQTCVLAKLPTVAPFLPTGFCPVAGAASLPKQMISPGSLAGTGSARLLSSGVPLLIGHTRSEYSLFSLGDAAAFDLTEEGLEARIDALVGAGQAPMIMAAYRDLYPGASPTDRYFILATDFNIGALTAAIADRRSRAGAAPVYAYVFEWKTPINGGKLRAHHGLDIPFIFETVDEEGKSMTGGGPSARKLSHIYASSWATFARTGNPNGAGLPSWPRYDPSSRLAMRIDNDSRVLPLLPDAVLATLTSERFAHRWKT